MMRIVAGSVMAGVLAVSGTALAQDRDFSWTGKLAQGKTIEIRGVSGDVRAVTGTGPDVEVTARKTARRSDPDEVEIKVIEHEGGVTICTIYPNSRRSRRDRDNWCGPGESHNNMDNNDVNVEFLVKVPAGVAFDGNTVNGDVLVEDLKSDAHAETVNGSIELATTGYAEAETVNGSIRASMKSTKWPERLDFRTVNGGITLDLPANAAADVEAETVNGNLESDFPLTIRGRFSPRRLSGQIGGGGPRLSLETVNGSIRLRKGL